MFLYAHDFVADFDVCSDIVADVFLTLWDMRDRISVDTVEAYLRTCVRNGCFLYFRRQRNFDSYSEFFKLTVDDFDSLDDIDTRVEDLLSAISTLSDRTRHVLEQCYLYDRKYREVAEEMGISESGVRKHIVKAYAAIREYFRNLNGQGDTLSLENK